MPRKRKDDVLSIPNSSSEEEFSGFEPEVEKQKAPRGTANKKLSSVVTKVTKGSNSNQSDKPTSGVKENSHSREKESDKRLPRHRDIVTLPHNGAHHPMGKNLQLFGAIVSGNPLRIEEFQQMLQKQSLTVGVSVPENSTQGLGRNGHFGVVFGTVIPFNHLKK
ncbi:uncharacterized protein LOC128550718 isoform X2 [Mercenaria mercenaria]|uniref:uncharacterized protein LOC128550718 isoform X2 n=1 Tax=Mercenaria mercenaria TaxID=6596 RepID=UPI00234F2E0A|nr:uncharacterized protein LOC128550718 isoform X2 [Mercenaria mercenaria]